MTTPVRVVALALVLSLAWLALAVTVAIVRPATGGTAAQPDTADVRRARPVAAETMHQLLVLSDEAARPNRTSMQYWRDRRSEKRPDAAARQAIVDPSMRTSHVRAPETGFQAFSTLWGGEPYLPADGDDPSVPTDRAEPQSRSSVAFRTVCVRLCDGYFYPLSHATTPDNFAADAERCSASCAAPVRLFVYPNPGGVPEDMEDLDGRAYTSLPTAFLYRSSYQRRCTCRPQPWTAEANARHDAYAAAAVVDRARGGRAAAIEQLASNAPRTIAPILSAGHFETDQAAHEATGAPVDTGSIPLPVRSSRRQAVIDPPEAPAEKSEHTNPIASHSGETIVEQQKLVGTNKRRRKRPSRYAEVRPISASPWPIAEARITTNDILRRNIMGGY
ncbi:MAG: DUF2865 domain-containing protein [Hyphomicrobiaceae bacterium]|nr:DUF2865 domain-containing protein [Hyphomicrobiaceae bacterium]